jgi:hypothetical protein
MNQKFKIDPINLIQLVYELSVPVGMGFLHFEPGPLSYKDSQGIFNNSHRTADDGSVEVNLDYVKGRGCKFNFTFKDEYCEFQIDRWFDHSDATLSKLIEQCYILEAKH